MKKQKILRQTTSIRTVATSPRHLEKSIKINVYKLYKYKCIIYIINQSINIWDKKYILDIYLYPKNLTHNPVQKFTYPCYLTFFSAVFSFNFPLFFSPLSIAHLCTSSHPVLMCSRCDKCTAPDLETSGISVSNLHC